MSGLAISSSTQQKTKALCTFHTEYLAIPVVMAAIIGLGIFLGWVVVQSGYSLPGNWHLGGAPLSPVTHFIFPKIT